MAYAERGPDYLERLKRRASKAHGIADSWHSAIDEVYRWAMPERVQVFAENKGNVPGFSQIFDATAPDAVEDFASFVTEALYPFDAEWLRFVPRADLNDATREQRRPLAEQLTARVQYLFRQSNFHPAVHSANKDLAVGTKAMRSEIDPYDQTRILFTVIPPRQLALEESSSGRITGIFRKLKPAARELASLWPGGTFSEAVASLARDKPEAEVEVEEAYTIEPRGGWHYCAYECGQEHIIQEADYRTCPVSVTRWSRTAGQVWGVGPTMRKLPDIKTANKLVELILKNASIAVTGIWQAEDDGVLNPATVRLVPGAIIPKAQGSEGLTPLKAPGDFDVSELVLEDLRKAIQRAHFTVRLPEREKTAFETQELVREMQRQLRGTFGQLRSEDIEPLVERVIDLGRQMGVISQDPVEKLVDLELIGPLAEAIRQTEATKTLAFVRELAATFGPEIALAATRFETVIPDAAEGMGIKSAHFRDEGTLQEMREKVEQMAAEVMANALLQQQAQAAAAPQQGQAQPPVGLAA